MREIKFRMWDNDKMEIVCDNSSLEISAVTKSMSYKSRRENLQIIFMQFTGFHDKNGKEIWEGDIVKFHAILLQPVSDIYWRNGFYMRGWEHLDLDSKLFKDNKMWEVIGNIYENPELLK